MRRSRHRSVGGSMHHSSRRQFLGAGVGSLLVACTRSLASPPRAALVPTPVIAHDEAPPPPKPARPGARTCVATADNIEGPFYKSGAPHRVAIATDREPGDRLVITGSVRSTSCDSVRDAVLDIWHADARGDYDNDGYHLRGTLATDASGRFELRTVVPGRYLNGRRYRPSHIHVKLRADGFPELTTQLYFEGDPYLDGDPFAVPSLVMPHTTSKGVRRAAFDFVLAR